MKSLYVKDGEYITPEIRKHLRKAWDAGFRVGIVFGAGAAGLFILVWSVL